MSVVGAMLLAMLGAGDAIAAEVADTLMLEEVSVSAVKQGSALSNEAVAASIVTRAEVEELNINALKGISDVVPNFYIPDYGSRITSSIYVRGLGARMDQPAVGLNVDNVPYLNKDAYDFDIADISRIEMIRGPQSTLYGRNTMGGLINITTLSPLNYQGFRALAEVGSGLYWKLNGGYYMLLKEDMGLAVNAGYTMQRGFFTNSYNGSHLDKERQWSARAKFDWRISPSLMLQNAFSTSGLHQGGYPYEYLNTGAIAYNDTCFYRRFCLNDGLTISYRPNRWAFTSITSVQYIDDNMTLDQDFLPVDYFTLTQKKKETGLTEDLVAKWNTALGKGSYNFLLGAFAFYKHLNMYAPVTFHDYGISQLIEQHRNEGNPTYPIAWNTRSFPLNSNFKIPTYGLAIYHESRYHLGNWHFTAGLRLDYEHASMSYHSYCDTGYTIFHKEADGALSPVREVAVNIDDTGDLSRDFLELLPKVSVLYDLPLSQSNVFVSVSKGYKAGGFNTQMFSDVLQQRLMGVMGLSSSYDIATIVTYKPEKSWNFEIGSHLRLSSTLDADINVFYIDCRDQQLTMFPDGNTTGRIMTNAGKTRSFGGEVALKWEPNRDLMFNVSYGYTNAKFRQFFNGINDFAGKRLPYAPENTLFAQVVKRFPLKAKGLTSIDVDANVRGVGRIYWNEENSVYQNFYAQLGASVALEAPRWSLTIWGQNLTDTKFHTFYFVSIGNEFVQRGKPLRVGATFRYSF